MNRVAFVADVHVDNHARGGGTLEGGLNARCRGILKALTDSVTRALDDACCAYVVLGDLVDTTHPKPQVLAGIQTAIEDTGHMVGQCWLLKGNHDMDSGAPGDHALGALQGHARIVERPTCVRLRDADLLLIPFQAGAAKDWLDGAVAEAVREARDPRKYPRCLGIHLGIEHEGTPPFLRDAHDSVKIEFLQELQTKYNLEAIVAGNWHRSRNFAGSSIMQVGALVPNGFKDDGLYKYGGHVTWRPGESSEGGPLARTEILGPRYVTLHGVPTKKDFGDEPSFVNVRCYAGRDEMDKARAVLEKAGLASFEVLPDRQEAQADTRDAAQAAASRETLDEALVGYVKAMPLDDGVDRAQVLKRAQRYMRDS